jgi:hypothetical protein
VSSEPPLEGPHRKDDDAPGTASHFRQLGERILHVQGDLAGARPVFIHAFGLAHRDSEVRAMALAALGLSGWWIQERRTGADAARTEARQRLALSRLHPGSVLALRLRIRLAAESSAGNRPDEMLQLLAEARSRGHPLALAEALNLTHHCLPGPQHADDRRPLADDLLKTGAITRRPSDTAMGLIWRASERFVGGEQHAGAAYADLLTHEPTQRHAAAAYVTSAMGVMLTIRSGKLAEAEAQAEICARAGAAAGHPEWMSWYTSQLVAIRWYQGRLGALWDTVATTIASPHLRTSDRASFVAAHAAASAGAGQQRDARGALARLAEAQTGDCRATSWLASMSMAIDAAAQLDDAATASHAYYELLPYAGLPAMVGPGVSCLGSVQYALGVACLVTGRVSRAAEHLEAAIVSNSALGNWPALTLARHRLGQALTARGGAGDARSAAAMLAESAAEANDFGMRLPQSSLPRRGRQGPLVCTRRGRRWRFELYGRSAMVEDMVGVRHLATLVANPGVGIPAVDLAAPHQTTAPASAQAVLDGVALRQYRERLHELAGRISTAEQQGRTEQLDQLRAEQEWIQKESRTGTGLGGRPRCFTEDAERSRVSVSKAIRRALERLAATDAVIGQQMRSSIQTGALCYYWPSGCDD